MTSMDASTNPYRNGLSSVGTTLSMLEFDAANVSSVTYVPDVIEDTIAGNAADLQPNLWMLDQHGANLTGLDSFYVQSWTDRHERQTKFQGKPYFVSSLTVGTDTGVLKALAPRISTVLDCQQIPHNAYPSQCHDSAALGVNFSTTQFRPLADSWTEDTFYIAPMYSFQMCSPRANNWTRESDHSHKIQEEMFLDLRTFESAATTRGWGYLYNKDLPRNFTYHCTATSTLGHFEPMNAWNGQKAQDMIGLGTVDDGPHFTGRNTQSDTHGLVYSPTAPGPLLISLRALFGNYTFFSSVTRANDTRGSNLDLCGALRIPLTGLCSVHDGFYQMCTPYRSKMGSTLGCDTVGDIRNPITTEEEKKKYGNDTTSSGTLAYELYMWLQKFNSWDSTMAALTFTNFYSAKAMLNPSRAEQLTSTSYDKKVGAGLRVRPTALPVYASPGFQTQKVHITLAAIIAISTLMALHLAGLLTLAIYTSLQPTWTATMDGFALLRIGKAMKDSLPLISVANAKDTNLLDETEGWIGEGSQDSSNNKQNTGQEGDGGAGDYTGDSKHDMADGGGRALLIGGLGCVSSKARYRTGVVPIQEEKELESVSGRWSIGDEELEIGRDTDICDYYTI